MHVLLVTGGLAGISAALGVATANAAPLLAAGVLLAVVVGLLIVRRRRQAR
ncbi:hypothetical protein [Micromonospora endolithica]|uniref:hypothetical protein n=1 Tax=Micromonospora endolithica TaxID=230091 RepID=UPI00131571CF|nr:hypothetical protein [Micromonospora endolithica]